MGRQVLFVTFLMVAAATAVFGRERVEGRCALLHRRFRAPHDRHRDATGHNAQRGHPSHVSARRDGRLDPATAEVLLIFGARVFEVMRSG